MLKHILFFIPLLWVFFSCSTTKYVPDGQYLLNKVTIETDSKDISSSDLEEYLQQKPNGNFLFIKKLGLKTYALSGRDTSKWRNRMIRKMGNAPVIYSSRLTEETENQLVRRMQNLGYLNAEVESDTVSKKKKKIEVTYHVKANTPYTIHDFKIGITDTSILKIMSSPRVKRNLKIEPSARFVPEKLDQQLQTLSNSMRNMGYYNLSKDNFYFLVDSALTGNQVDLTLMIRDTWSNAEDILRNNAAFNRYQINSVTIISGYDQFDPESRLDFAVRDTVNYKGLNIVYGSRRFIRASVLYYNCFVRPERYYSDRLLENTYSSLNSLSAVKQASIYFRENARKDSSLLDAYITLAPSNIFYWQTGIDGTNSAGDLGVAGYIAFQHRNIFNGSETFAIKLNGALESITSSGLDLSNNFYQYGVDFSLTLPRFLVPFIPKSLREQTNSKTIFSAGINWQNRPEYNRRFLNLDWMYKWSTLRNRLNHTLDLYNINYIVTPWMSDTFRTYLDISENAILRESYKDQFITRTNYSFAYTSNTASRAQYEGYTIRTSADVAGTLPYLISKLSGAEKKDGSYNMFGIPFAQYFKVSTDITRLFMIDRKNFVALHLGLGVAYPYGNSSIVPYEQRFFGGGPNSVRGWSTRTLGPGSYDPQGDSDFLNQSGDIKMLLNFEYRLKTNTFLEYAAFIDAGNVWTIKSYENQAKGEFRVDSFWKEMGLSWGLGIRPNFGFILIRLDVGMKIYNPETSATVRWPITSPKFSRDIAFHFAIGYPF